MAIPPTDNDGNVLPYDDPEIHPDDGLLRFINPIHVKWDSNRQSYRVSSAAFSESSKKQSTSGGMSVNVERLIIDAGDSVDSGIREDWGLVRIVTLEMRQQGYLVGLEPLDSKPYHGNVWHSPTGKPNGKIKVGERFVWIIKAKNIA